jgi:perosamine synthetase
LAAKVKPIPVGRPVMDEREAEAARRAILSGWITMGPEVAAFEAEFAAAVGARHACAVSSGTTALHLALLAAGVAPRDEVITASFSFIATASAVRYCGATPVFVDIDPATFNIDPGLVEAAITPKTRAILCVHQMGMPCDLIAFRDIAGRHGLRLIEDAACAIGSEILWERTGRGGVRLENQRPGPAASRCARLPEAARWDRIGMPHGDLACFSFHPRKVLTTGDGGMITTNNEEWDRQVRLWRHHGMNVEAHVRHASDRVIWESYDTLGYNYRMTDIQGAIGRVQLQRLDDMIARRRELAARYGKLLRELDGVTAPTEPGWARSNWQSYCVRLADTFDQRAVMQRMLDEGVATRRGVMCAHREPAYPEGTWRRGPGGLRASEEAQDHTVILPLYPQMTGAEQETVVETLRRALCSRS